MSTDFSFKAAWFRNPFGAVPVAGRAQMLQEVGSGVGEGEVDLQG